MQKFFKEEFQVPIDAMVEVANVVCEHNLHHVITEVDDYEEIITCNWSTRKRKERSSIKSKI